MIYDLIIIGSGAAGLSAALYAGRYKLATLVVGKEFGGETATAWTIENYPGIVSVDGYDLMQTMKAQARQNGAEIKEGTVTFIRREGNCFILTFADGGGAHGHALILAAGARRRHLNLPREDELLGKGVHYCFTCDGPLYGSKTVAVVGGGDSSVKAANFLAEYAAKVYLITREKEVRGEPANMDQMGRLSAKIEILTETEIAAFVGEEKLESITLSVPYRGSADLAVDGLFAELGFEPDKTLALQLGLDLDEKGYIKVDNRMRTNIPGVFGAGDATNHFGSFKQDITAAALGAVAATSSYEWKHLRLEGCALGDTKQPI